jgi:hypothetical protein
LAEPAFVATLVADFVVCSNGSHPRQHRHYPFQKSLSRTTLLPAQREFLHRQIQISRDLHRRTFRYVKETAMIQFGISPIAFCALQAGTNGIIQRPYFAGT